MRLKLVMPKFIVGIMNHKNYIYLYGISGTSSKNVATKRAIMSLYIGLQ
jgi:hypothetical protein